MFSVPHSIFCYFLATPATYFAKMAKKSKFHCNWLIFRKIALDQGKKSSSTSKMCPMVGLGCFTPHITWKDYFWKLSRKPHLEYSHGFLKCIPTQKYCGFDLSFFEIANGNSIWKCQSDLCPLAWKHIYVLSKLIYGFQVFPNYFMAKIIF